MIKRKTPLKRSTKPIARKTPLRRQGGPIKKKRLTSAQKLDMHDFFLSQIMKVPERCENCSGLLNVPLDKIRFVMAHILPKATFESSATNKDNLMYLGSAVVGSECNCHDNWDRKDASDRQKMNCYTLAIFRVTKFYNELTPHEQIKAEKYLNYKFDDN